MHTPRIHKTINLLQFSQTSVKQFSTLFQPAKNEECRVLADAFATLKESGNLQWLSRSMNTSSHVPKERNYDAVIVGGGHNGLVAAAYLAKSGIK